MVAAEISFPVRNCSTRNVNARSFVLVKNELGEKKKTEKN
jgi:hypothetical protein